MADMVPQSHGGNPSSTVPEKYRVLKRASRGRNVLSFGKMMRLPILRLNLSQQIQLTNGK